MLTNHELAWSAKSDLVLMLYMEHIAAAAEGSRMPRIIVALLPGEGNPPDDGM